MFDIPLCKEFERLHKWLKKQAKEEALVEEEHFGFRELCIYSDCEECSERKNATRNKDR